MFQWYQWVLPILQLCRLLLRLDIGNYTSTSSATIDNIDYVTRIGNADRKCNTWPRTQLNYCAGTARFALSVCFSSQLYSFLLSISVKEGGLSNLSYKCLVRRYKLLWCTVILVDVSSKTLPVSVSFVPFKQRWTAIVIFYPNFCTNVLVSPTQ